MEVKDVEQYEMNSNKIRSFDDLLLIIGAMLPGHVYLSSLGHYYEEFKHLAKDED